MVSGQKPLDRIDFDGTSELGRNVLQACLSAWIVAIAVAIWFRRSTVESSVQWVLYREPKHVVVLLGASLWLLLWTIFAREKAQTLARATRNPTVFSLAILVSWLSLGRLWVLVPANHTYELIQYCLLGALFAVLMNDSPLRARRATSFGLVAAAALVTTVAALQGLGWIPFLKPIDPELGGHVSSLFGYKNPTALFLLAQLFLLARLLLGARSAKLKGALFALLLAETGYLLILRSRTAYLAFFITLLGLALLWSYRRFTLQSLSELSARTYGPIHKRPLFKLLSAGFILVLAVLIGNSSVRDRAVSAVELAHPVRYLESDRGTYLLNTTVMIREHPQGVGLGDWQTHYPVFRTHDRSRSYSDQFEVRRAHSDHVQMLGEGGYPGVLLWGVFLMICLADPLKRFLRAGEEGVRAEAFLDFGQRLVICTAMCGDYFLEMPSHKATFFLMLVATQAKAVDETSVAVKVRSNSHLFRGAAIALALFGTGLVCLYANRLATTASRAADLESSWQAKTGVRLGSPVTPLNQAAAKELVNSGNRLFQQAVETKTLHRDLVLHGWACQWAGDPLCANQAAKMALSRHPFYRPAFELMARVGPVTEQQSWSDGSLYILKRAERGFCENYPSTEVNPRLNRWLDACVE